MTRANLRGSGYPAAGRLPVQFLGTQVAITEFLDNEGLHNLQLEIMNLEIAKTADHLAAMR